MEKAQLTLDGKTIELPIVKGTEDEKAIDVTQLRSETKYITFDPSYGNTGSCSSDITYINGEKGILRYRGYPIEQLADNSSFVEVIYLLLYGELPNETELVSFNKEITYHSLIHEDMKRFFDGYPMNAHPMGVLASTVAALSTFYPARVDGDIELNIIRLLAKVKTLAAFAYKKSIGQPLIYPKNELGFEVLRSDNSEEFRVIGTVGANTAHYNDKIGKYITGAFAYKVRAFNQAGKSEASNIVSVWF